MLTSSKRGRRRTARQPAVRRVRMDCRVKPGNDDLEQNVEPNRCTWARRFAPLSTLRRYGA
jgi:hypothetical protein